MNTETIEKLKPVELDLDPYAMDVLLDPYPFHEIVRQAGPVVFFPLYGVYGVGRYDETHTVFTDWKRFSTTGGIGLGDARKPGANFRPLNPMLEVDPPKHTKIRSVANKVISPVTIRKWRSDMEQQAETLVSRLMDKQAVDGVQDIAEEFVFKVFPEAMGLPFNREAVLAIGDMSFNQSGPQNELYHRAMARAQPFLEWYEQSQHRDNVVPGGIAEQFFKFEDAGELAPGVAKSLMMVFVRGGTDSTIAGIASTLMHLARNRDQWQFLKENPGKVRAALEEGIRLETPFQTVYRVTMEDTVLGGVQLEADRKVAMFVGAANRDPRKWPNPDQYDITRQTLGHLAFGTADHNCIGQMIARLESECLLTALLKHVKHMELTAEPVFRPVNQMRALDRLPLRLVPE